MKRTYDEAAKHAIKTFNALAATDALAIEEPKETK